jgi:hypothetical protein
MIMNEDSGVDEAIVQYMKVRIITAFCLEEIGYVGYMTNDNPSLFRLRYLCDVIAKIIKKNLPML